MHSYGWWRKRVVWGEDESAPVLAAMVRCVLRTRDDVVPSVCYLSVTKRLREVFGAREGLYITYSKMLDSEGWAVIYGGGFSEMVLYSRVNCAM